MIWRVFLSFFLFVIFVLSLVFHFRRFFIESLQSHFEPTLLIDTISTTGRR